MTQDVFHNAIKVLAGDDAPRAWSFIVTVFGDLAQNQGDAISGPILGDILSPIGVRPEAMRVALHRLRNEGWIQTTKQGREALHQLSALGLKQSTDAGRRIYASSHKADPQWHVLCYPSVLSGDEHRRTGRLEADGYVAIASGVYLANGAISGAVTDAFALQGSIGDVPDWLSQSLVSTPMISAFKDFSAALQLVDFSAAQLEGLTASQIATLRALIVHRWRKLIFKLPNIPDALFGTDFAGTACRTHVMSALDALPRPDLSALIGSALKH